MKKKPSSKKDHSCKEHDGNFTINEFKDYLKECEEAEPLRLIKPCGCAHVFTKEDFISLIEAFENMVDDEALRN